MQELEKILEILDKLQFFGGQRAGRELWNDKQRKVQDEDIESFNQDIESVRDFIRKYMNGKDNNVPAKDGWIPVEERLPEEETSVWVTVKHSSWISGYGSDFIPEEEWECHPESSGTHKGKYEEGIWWYEDEENEWIRCDEEPNEARDLGAVYDTVIAWQPLPEPYRPERRNRRNGRG